MTDGDSGGTQITRPGFHAGPRDHYFVSFTVLNRRAFPITDTELMDIAAPAIIGLSNHASPRNGTKTPAAIGIPTEL